MVAECDNAFVDRALRTSSESRKLEEHSGDYAGIPAKPDSTTLGKTHIVPERPSEVGREFLSTTYPAVGTPIAGKKSSKQNFVRESVETHTTTL